MSIATSSCVVFAARSSVSKRRVERLVRVELVFGGLRDGPREVEPHVQRSEPPERGLL